MTLCSCEGVSLDLDDIGDGPCVILIHGAWSDRRTWDRVFEPLTRRFRTLRYDRRGYGQSQRPGTSPKGHAHDLLALIRTLKLQRPTLIGNSVGGLIATHAALLAPTLVKYVVAHEPPIFRIFELSAQGSPIVARAKRALYDTLAAARNADYELAAKLYVEGAAAYSGAWTELPEPIQQEFIQNAEPFLADSSELGELDFGPSEFERLQGRITVTRGARTSAYMKHLMERLQHELPALDCHVFDSGGHVPHQSSAQEFLKHTIALVERLG